MSARSFYVPASQVQHWLSHWSYWKGRPNYHVHVEISYLIKPGCREEKRSSDFLQEKNGWTSYKSNITWIYSDNNQFVDLPVLDIIPLYFGLLLMDLHYIIVLFCNCLFLKKTTIKYTIFQTFVVPVQLFEMSQTK